MDDILSEAGFTMIMKKITGYTLIELMVTIGVIGIVMMVGMPMMSDWIKPDKIETAQRELHSGLLVARSEAIRWSSVACVCSSANASDAAPSCSGSGSWETGWIAFTNASGNCSFNAAADRLVKTWDGKLKGVDIFIRNDNALINSKNFVRFNSRGQAQQAGGSAQRGVFTLSDDKGLVANDQGDALYARGVDLHITGRARMIKYANALSLP